MRGQKGGALVGITRRGKATKIMAMADRHGLPVACGIASGQRHEAQLVKGLLDSRFVEEKPQNLIGDKAYDSNKLDAEMAAEGVEMIAPNHVTRKRTQDGRRLRRYCRRWRIERLFAWLMRSRRLVTRYEHKAQNFLALLQLACAQLLWRRF
jgi:transposase